MIEIDFKAEAIQQFIKSLGVGWYRVTKEGTFIECNPTARKIFRIPQKETDLSNYSIKEMYVVPAERKIRVNKLLKNPDQPLCSTINLIINGEKKLFLDICRVDRSYNDGGTLVAFISEIQESTLFPKIFDILPMGIYEVDGEDKIMRVNKKFLEVLKFEEKEILGKHLHELCEEKDQLKTFNRALREQGFAHDIFRLKNGNNQVVDVEFFSQIINGGDNMRWGMINDVTARERYYHALDRLPTGFFYIENKRIKDCNDYYAQIHGLENKEAAIGIHASKFFADNEARKKYLKELELADAKGKPLRNYEFQIIRVNDGTIHDVSVDSQLVKDTKGNVIGMEGTVRDITEKKALERQAKEAHNGLVKTETETHKFIHTLFHPVVKFTGKSKLLHQGLDILNQIMRPIPPPGSCGKELADELMTRLVQIRDKIQENDEIDPVLEATLEEKLTKIINVFDNILQTEKDPVILDSRTSDTAIWILEELKGVNYFRQNKLRSVIKQDFIEFLQGILLNHLKQNAEILVGETEMMNRRVESIRTYISLEKKRQYSFAKHDIKKILEENIQLFKPILLEKNIEIEPRFRGDLNAVISKQDIDRVISNLFLNVRNYSYKGEGRFVKVKARELQPQEQVEISIENFGLPIKKEEITSGDIFKFGYRGAFGYKGDRDGLGAGLADTMDVIQAHGGEISVTSKPVGDDGSPPRYQVPYLTKVTIMIPKKKME